MAKAVTERSFEKQVLHSGGLVCVLFWSKNNKACLQAEATLDALAEVDPHLKVCKVDADTQHALVSEYGVRNTPTVIGFQYGERLGTASGLEPDDEIVPLLRTAPAPKEPEKAPEPAPTSPAKPKKQRPAGAPDYNQEYFYMRPGHSNYPSLVLWGEQDSIFACAEPIEHESLHFIFDNATMPKKPQMGDGHYLYPTFVVSQRVKDHLEALQLKQVQFVPATIKDKEDTVHGGYYAMHVYNTVHCADLEASEWTPSIRNPERVMSFDRVVLDNAALDEVPLQDRLAIQLGEQRLTHLYHRTVVDHLLKIQPEGIRFYSIAGDGREAFIEEMLDFILLE